MKILSECNLATIVAELLDGKTFVFPTETAYGLGCDAINQSAVDKIFKIKGRTSDKPLLVVVPDVAMAKKYLKWNPVLEKISQKYWPGPLTVVGEYKRKFSIFNFQFSKPLAKGVVGKDGTLAVRVSGNSLLKSITEKMGRPLVATSGNVAGAGEVYNARVAENMLCNRAVAPDLLFDGGEIPRHPPTTIVSVVSGKLKIIRQGEIKITNF